VHSPLVHVLPTKTLQTNADSSCVKANLPAHLVLSKLSCTSNHFVPATAQHMTLQRNQAIFQS